MAEKRRRGCEGLSDSSKRQHSNAVATFRCSRDETVEMGMDVLGKISTVVSDMLAETEPGDNEYDFTQYDINTVRFFKQWCEGHRLHSFGTIEAGCEKPVADGQPGIIAKDFRQYARNSALHTANDRVVFNFISASHDFGHLYKIADYLFCPLLLALLYEAAFERMNTANLKEIMKMDHAKPLSKKYVEEKSYMTGYFITGFDIVFGQHIYDGVWTQESIESMPSFVDK